MWHKSEERNKPEPTDKRDDGEHFWVEDTPQGKVLHTIEVVWERNPAFETWPNI